MDTRIALGVNPLVIPDQSAPLHKALALNALMGQGDLQNLQLQEGQRTLRQNQAIDQALQGAGSADDVYKALLRISPKQAAEFQKANLEGQKTQGEINKSRLEQQGSLAAGFASLPTPEARAAAYPNLVAQHNSLLLPNQKPLENEPWNEQYLPNLQKFVVAALPAKDALERQDTRAAAMPSTVVALSGQAMPTQPQDVIDPTSGAALRPQQQAPITAQPLSTEQVMPQMDVNAVGANPQIAELRAEAKRQRGFGTKAGNENAKAYMDEAARLEDNDVKMREKYGQVTDAPGIAQNKVTGEYSMNGKPISAEDIQKIAIEYAKARGTNLTVENYPNPTTMTDPVTGKQKSVQFGKSGSYREVPYDPPSNDSERLAAGYHDRMVAAEQIINKIGPAGNPTVGQAVGESLGAVPGRMASSPEQQQYKQAQSDWVRAKLRKESGAVIGPKEMQDEIDTYFPRLGDGPEVIKQKAEARAIAQEAMLKNAGPAATNKPAEAPSVPSAGKIPPPSDRIPGNIYSTPKGKLKWTGTGWVQP